MKSNREIWYSRNPSLDDGIEMFMQTVDMVMQEYAEEYHKEQLKILNDSFDKRSVLIDFYRWQHTSEYENSFFESRRNVIDAYLKSIKTAKRN
jgi:hypothetical protein